MARSPRRSDAARAPEPRGSAKFTLANGTRIVRSAARMTPPSPPPTPRRSRGRAGWPIGAAVRRAWHNGYHGAELRADVLAGLVVGVVALPLSMALAVAVGVAPQHGLYTSIVAGALIALAGGSKFQISGPTAAFIVVLAPIVSRYGLAGLLTAGMMSGLILIAMGLGGMGRLVEYIPYPVTTGFTAGIATVIAILQLKDVFALPTASLPDGTLAKLELFWRLRASASWRDLCVAAFTLACLVGLPRLLPNLTRRLPAPLPALAGAALGSLCLQHLVPEWSVATIGTRFSTLVDGQRVAGIPPTLPDFASPWSNLDVSFELVRNLTAPAFTIAALGAIESLLSAVIADGLTGTKHDPDAELVGLGIGNVVAPFFGGIAATGALARTATNIRAGARSPISGVVHSATVLLAVLLLAPLVAYIPMAALAALLLLVAWNMSELRHVLRIVRIAPRSDALVLLTCFALTVIWDMVIAVSVGIVLAALLFMRRMAELTQTSVLDGGGNETSTLLPDGVGLYEVAGPLFFGAAQRAMNALDAVGATTRVVVLSLSRVPTIDATGLVALESALVRLKKMKKRVVVAGPLPEPRALFGRAELTKHHNHVLLAQDLTSALQLAERLAREEPPSSARR